MNFAALILAGGKSSRMRCDKAWVEIDGQSLLARQIGLVKTSGAKEIFISGPVDSDYAKLGCPVLADKFPDAGPLAGIERGLTATTASVLLVLAVDMPKISGALLNKLVSRCIENRGVIPAVDGRIEPLAACYPRIASRFATEMLLEGTRAPGRSAGPTDFARRCIESGLAELANLPAAVAGQFASLNTPEDLQAHQQSVL